jgi:hypothetical protein
MWAASERGSAAAQVLQTPGAVTDETGRPGLGARNSRL